jgi:hypothetical protein
MRIYTHYTTRGASSIDRIYITQDLRQYKKHTETVAAAFTDHLDVLLYMAFPIPTIIKGPGYWKLNSFLLTTEGIIDAFIAEWSKWKTSQHRYASQVHWCCTHVQRKIRYSSIHTGNNNVKATGPWKITTTKYYTTSSRHR